MNNPLFPTDSDEDEHSEGFALPPKADPVSPLPEDSDERSDQTGGAEPAADLIRQKLERIYAQEPGAAQEAREAEALPVRSKHQQFMYELSTSGRPLAEIQTAWHNYYIGLPDNEKHEVWREFYQNASNYNQQQAAAALAEHDLAAPETPPSARPKAKRKPRSATKKKPDTRTPQTIKKDLLNTLSAGGQLKARHHLQSLLFGLGVGCVVMFIFLFGFFNEFLLAPFYQPSLHSGNTPIILDASAPAPNDKSEVIIPKINVEVPVDYSETSTEEAAIESDLQNGVVHYPTTVMPGQNGNLAIFGHSAMHLFSRGAYKFAFMELNKLSLGDTFYLTYQGKVYIYKVISRTVVQPTDVGVLGPVPGQTATATLITCDPPGTSWHRLVVVGQQISPDPAHNKAPTTLASAQQPTELPSNGPSLWSRFVNWLF